MKLAVIKLGARIAYGGKDTSGGGGEAKSIIKMLHLAGAEIDIYTKILSKDKNPNHLKFYQIEDEFENINDREYDSLIVLNGNINFFGGAECRDQILNYHLINNFKGQVYYIYCDPSLLLTQLWGSIEKKEWGSNYRREDIEITRKDIIYVSQPYNLVAVKELIAKTKITIKNVIHYPFEKFPCLNDKVKMKETPNYDLLYGGTMRGGKRIDKMVKFYFGYSDDINVEMFGKIKEEDLKARAKKNNNSGRPPKYGDPVQYDEFLNKMNDTLTHVVIGDKWYEGKDMAQRCYESIWANVITLIDIELDPKMKVFGESAICKKFNYVNNAKEVEKRIKAIKENPQVRKQILEEQFNTINFNADIYCKEFLNIIKMNVVKEEIINKTQNIF